MTTEEPEPPRLKVGIGIVLIASLFFATATSLVATFGDRFPIIQLVFIQNIVSLFCILPIACRKGLKELATKKLAIHLVRDFFGVGSFILYFLAIRYLNLVDATTLHYSAPFFVPIIWRIWRHQKIPKNVWWSIIVGFLGVAVMMRSGSCIYEMGFFFGVFAGIASALALTALRVLNLEQEPMSRTLFYYFVIGAVLTAPFAIPCWEWPVSGWEWGRMLGVGFASVIGQILLTVAYRFGTASYLSPLSYVTVIYNGIIAYFAFGQVLSWHSWVGTALIILGGTLTYLLKKKSKTLLKVFEASAPHNKPPL